MSDWLATVPFSEDEYSKITGIDISDYMIQYARQHYGRKNILFQQDDLTKLNIPDKSYDCIWVERVLHHVTNVETVLAQLTRLLKPDGQLVIAEPYIPSTIITPISLISRQEFANEWCRTVANGEIGLTLDDKMHTLGYKPKFKFGSFVCMNDYDTISKYIDLSLFLSNLTAEQITLQGLLKSSA